MRIVFARWGIKAGDFSKSINVQQCTDRVLSLRYRDVGVVVYSGYFGRCRSQALLGRLGRILGLQGTVAMTQETTRLAIGDVVVCLSDEGKLGVIELSTEYTRKEMIWALG